jgi:hypothetical protein
MLRPVLFKIISTTQLRITFNDLLSELLTTDNFKIEAISGANLSLEIISVQVDEKSVTINTRPHHAKAYYLLKLLDAPSVAFQSKKGVPLVNDDSSRDIYFIGIEKVNQIRDDIFYKTPAIYNLDGTLVNSILSTQADNILNAQHAIGSLLNDNYISNIASDEYRVRGPGASDRLANENAYEINRVSPLPSGSAILTRTIEIDSTDIYPVNLRQEFVDLFSINQSEESASFNGFLISLPQKNIIKVAYAKLIKNTDSTDCDGNIGTEYNIEKFKYSILSNRFDQKNSYSNHLLESNQVLFSDFGNWQRPEVGDTIIISYYYDNASIGILEDTITVFETINVLNESIPSNSKMFTLKNGLIIDSLDEQPATGGITFKSSENSSVIPEEFSKELVYNFSKLPSNSGEYSVNYETGEVYLVGTEIGKGTGNNYFFADYRHKKVYQNNLDYSFYNGELNLNYLRPVFEKSIKISFDYESIFAKDIDYKEMCHKEVLAEDVQNRVTSSFSLKTKNGPITDVFRIFNRTTGEIYSLNYFYENDIYFTGNTLPSAKEASGEFSNFNKISGEELYAAGYFVTPVHYATITSNLSNLNIEFSPGIPAELIDQLSTTYISRNLTQEIDDYQISGFYTEDSNGLITGFSIPSGSVLPSVGAEIQIGTTAFIYNFKNNKILSKTFDSIGSAVNSSVSLDKNIFVNEKFFNPISKNSELTISSAGSQSYVISSDQSGTLNKNLSTLRKKGDYCVDYNNGVIYVSTNPDQDKYGGLASYITSISKTQNKNILSVNKVYKKLQNYPDVISAEYSSITFSESEISISDLENSTSIYSGEEIIDFSGMLKETLLVDENYQVITDRIISSISFIGELKDLFGENLDSSIESQRYEESNSENLIKKINVGGKNYYIPNYVSYSYNIIDFKPNISSVITTAGSFYELRFRTPDISYIFEIKNSGGSVLLDSALNFSIISNIAVSSISTHSATELKVYYYNIDPNYTFNPGFDFISNGSDRWLITGLFSGYFTINKISDVYSQIFSEDTFDIIVRPNVSIGEYTLVQYPITNFMSSGSKVSMSYITAYTPSPGTALAVDYSCGTMLFDYIYLKDEISVYYEYGDNEIDWSINNSISEGQEYYVSYKYGALRRALRKNFGTLTSIPFFTNQSLNTDRELYRDALSGVLSTFPKGPTNGAITDLVKSITKTSPKINELSFGSWILGRDYLNPQQISYKGSLEFADGKFGSGLKINKDNSVWAPAISNISLDEGTIEMWVSPDWYGINNDADLTFSFDNVGTQKWHYLGGDPFSKKSGYDVVGSIDENDSRHGFDFSGGNLRIYKVSVESDGYIQSDYNTLFGIYKKDLIQNREIKSSETIEFSINYSYLPQNSLSFAALVESGEYKAFSVLNDNNHNTFELNVVGSTLKYDGLTKIFSVISEEFDTLIDFGPPYPTATCKCSFDSQLSVLENFDKLEIKISFDDVLEKESLFNEPFWREESIKSLMIMDNLGRFYQVVASSDLYGKKYYDSIPDIISEIYVSRYPINNPELSSRSNIEINDINFSSFVIIKKQIKLILNDEEKSRLFFGLSYAWNFDWSTKTKVIYSIDPIQNLSSIGNGAWKNNFFYTDLNSSNLFSLIGDDISSGSITIGVFGISSANIYKNLISIDNKLSLNDIYIGSTGVNPRSNTFALNRLSEESNAIGISKLIDTDAGIFIGYDPACLSPINNDIGQWLLRARFLKYSDLPYDIEIIDGNYQNLTESVVIDNPIKGSVKTSGAFSSISKGRRTESGDCIDTEECSKHFRFLGNKLLESDGWSLIQSSDSDVIDYINEGREAESYSWRMIGSFDTQNSSGIYRVDSISSYSEAEEYFSKSVGLTVKNTCIKGNLDFSVSAKITYIDSASFGLSNDNIVQHSGIIIAEINTEDYDVGISLARDAYGNGLISLVDMSLAQSIGVANFNWNDGNYHRYNILFDRENSILSVYIDDIVLIQKDISLISNINSDTCLNNKNGSYSILFIDQRLIQSSDYFLSVTPPEIDINLVEGNANYNPGTIKLEDSDLYIVSNNVAIFELHSNPNTIDEIIQDGYSDGYIIESDVDEIMITSDNERFFVDTGKSEAISRLSIFKDGKGFLNFRIIDDKKEDNGIYNIATNIKSFIPGEKHHIAASWKINTPYEKDEMHLFIDGQEVPSLFKFGGYAPIKFNSKFSDISKENLWNYIEKKIIFPELITDGSISAGENIIYSSSMIIDDSLIGRTILFGESTDLYGKAVIIISVGSGWIAVGDYLTTEPYIFESTESGLEFRLAPYAEDILTDIKNDKFSVSRTTCDEQEEELGGIFYEIIDGNVLIKNSAQYFGYRCNNTSGIIEFVKRDDSCIFVDSVLKTDIDIHIKTYGLTSRRFKDIISISGTSLFTDEGYDPFGTPNSRDDYSIIMTTGPRPKNLSDVSIRKYILNNYSISLDTIVESAGEYTSVFEIGLSEEKISLETINVLKNNDGRYLEIIIDSDNIDFAKLNDVTIFGVTPSGYSSETIVINKNGSFYTSERYLSLDKISGTLNIIDEDFNFISLISIIEKNSIFVQDGSGDRAEIYRFSNGSFFLGIYGESEYAPFELPYGYYLIDYSANLKVSLPEVGERLLIGNDITETKPLLGSIDDFQVLNTMLMDVRPWQNSTGVRTITSDYYRESPACITSSNLMLVDFTNPVEKQSRRLRTKQFLDSENNFTYTLSLHDRERLIEYINNEEEFVNYMMFLGYSKSTAEETYYESNKADGGPLYNSASYIPRIGNYFISPVSVNSNFGQSGRFERAAALSISNNNNILRNSSGTIEFWYQPKLDTFNDGDYRVLFESSSVLTDSVKSTTPYLIKLNTPASEIISVRLLSSNKLSDSAYYSESEKSSILFDEISIIESTGRYSKGTGVLKDFSNGASISFNGMEINLAEALPGSNIDVVVTYVPRQYSGEKISIYKDKFSRIISRIETKDASFMIPADIIWTEGTWHRISLAYDFSSQTKFIKMFVDGMVYNTIYQYEKDEYPDTFDSLKIISSLNISLSEQFSQIIIGNRLDRSLSATGLIDNVRISRVARTYVKDVTGEEYDINYSANTDLISPVQKDDLTTYINNFDYASLDRNIYLANIIDPKYGIFDFEVLIGDDFNRVVGINGGEIEDLIIDLISRIKPAHSNGYVKFIDKKCKE